MALPCCACSFSYVDSSGNHHVIGLVDVAIRPAADARTLAGSVVDVTSVGLIVSSTAQGGYVSLGYNREATAALRDNALVIGNPVNLERAARMSKEQQ